MIIDTNFLIDLQQERAANRSGPASHFLHVNRASTIRTTVISVAEFSAGFPSNAAARFFLVPFHVVRLFPEAAYEAASVDRELMRLGARLGENDNLIAGIAHYFGEPLVTNDAAFDRVPNLRVRTY